MYYSEHDFIVPLTTTCSVDELKAFKKPPQIPSKDSLLSRAAAARTERQETLNALFDFQLMQTQRLDADRIISEELPNTKPETLEVRSMKRHPSMADMPLSGSESSMTAYNAGRLILGRL